MKRSDELLKKMASEYVGQYGEQLQSEREQLEREGAQPATHGLDASVARQHKARSRRVSWRVWGAAAAACLALLLLMPRVLQQPQSGAPIAEAPEQSVQASPLPISFTLAKNFTVSHREQDREKTVYYLANSRLDDVVMTLERAADAPEQAYDELHELEISGKTVYGRYRADYSILTFDCEGIRYTLTCRHDFQTLAELGESILL